MIDRPSAPLFATINVTTACNLDCSYCYMRPRSNEYISRLDFKRVVDELAGLPVFYINISGGEPFVHPEIADFLRMAHESFQHVVLITNGTILRQEHCDAIAGIIQRKGTFSVQVSLDAVDPEINSLTRTHSGATRQNIRTLAGMGAHVVVAAVVTRTNADTIFDTLLELSNYTRHFHLMNVHQARLAPGVEERLRLPEDREAELWEAVRQFADAHNLVIDTPRYAEEGCRGCAQGAPCAAAFTYVVIDPSLRVRPCDRLVDVVIGDLRESTLAQIWHSQAIQPIISSSKPFCCLPVGSYTRAVNGRIDLPLNQTADPPN